MKINKEKLASKGWSEEEIEKAISILEQGRRNIRPRTELINKSLYWVELMLIIIGNFTFSIMLIPLILTLPTISLILIVLLVSFAFGGLMSIIIKDLEDLRRKHHLIILFIVPIIAIINFLIVVNLVNNDILSAILQHHQNPLIVGVAYLIGFMIPYTYLVVEEKWI